VRCADSCARDRRQDRFRENRTAIAFGDAIDGVRGGVTVVCGDRRFAQIR